MRALSPWASVGLNALTWNPHGVDLEEIGS
jgi:hypothetical protein